MYSLKSWMVVHLFLLLLFPWFSYSLDSLISFNSSVNRYQSWNNNLNSSTDYWFYDDVTIGPTIVAVTDEHRFSAIVFGFFNNRSTTNDARNNNFYLVIGLIPVSSSDRPVVLWCANGDKPVRKNAILHFTAKGGLQLEDFDGTLVWSTNTSGLLASRLNISSEGNLMLFDGENNVIWQSVNYPTDIWLPNQHISNVKGLTSRNSSSNLASGLYSFTVGYYNWLAALIDSDRPQYYYTSVPYYNDYFDKGFSFETTPNYALFKVNRNSKSFQYIRLEPTGHLILYKLPNYEESNDVTSFNLFEKYDFNDCDYPTACGSYGVCYANGLCSCPPGNTSSSYFTQSQDWAPNLGCRPVTPLSCENKHLHSFLELKNVSYFNLEPSHYELDSESCKRACLDNCTCKAAFLSSGKCSLKSHLYSLKHDDKYDTVAFIKVQNRAVQDKRKSYLVAVLVSTLSVGVVIILVVSCYYYKMLIKSDNNNEEEGNDQVIGRLKRFSLLELKSATRDFQVKLGRGGFGSVFEGDLADGTKVAVKCLDSIGQGRK